MNDIEKIKQAVIKNCGGFETASDAEFLAKWQSLDEDTKQKYLKSVNENKNQTKVKNANN